MLIQAYHVENHPVPVAIDHLPPPKPVPIGTVQFMGGIDAGRTEQWSPEEQAEPSKTFELQWPGSIPADRSTLRSAAKKSRSPSPSATVRWKSALTSESSGREMPHA